jgi:maltose/moltooligosaccharide transporter
MNQTIKPRLSLAQIINMSVGFMGIQFGFALQNANTSRIFSTLGANADDIPILWVAAPLTGLLVQPIIGYMSDRTWHPTWGRRRPFFFAGAILATIALVLMPQSKVLWMAGALLWMMDASINVSMEPFRAFVGDMLPNEQRTTGFSVQTFFIGVGAMIASGLPSVLDYFGVPNSAPSGVVPDTVRWSFYIGAVAYFCCILWTVLNTHQKIWLYSRKKKVK